jgi:hypothetical protein
MGKKGTASSLEDDVKSYWRENPLEKHMADEYHFGPAGIRHEVVAVLQDPEVIAARDERVRLVVEEEFEGWEGTTTRFTGIDPEERAAFSALARGVVREENWTRDEINRINELQKDVAKKSRQAMAHQEFIDTLCLFGFVAVVGFIGILIGFFIFPWVGI